MTVTEEFLINNPSCIFVYGDNTQGKGKAGAAQFRDMPNTYGFITKRYPCTQDRCYYTQDEYKAVYDNEIEKLKFEIYSNPQKTYLISKLGSELANKFGIFEAIIASRIKEDLKGYRNVKFLW